MTLYSRHFMTIACSALFALQAVAVPDEPIILEEFQGVAISGDARYVVSDLYGTVIIYDTDTDEYVSLIGNGESISHSLGLGRAINYDGSVIVGESTSCGGAGVYKNRKWTALTCPNPDLTNLANAITPNNSRICGSFGMRKRSTEESSIPMLLPGYWDLKSDGSYSEPIMLPYPELDFTGRVPQYITAHTISNDGKTIVGLIRDYAGFMCQLIVYKEDSEGNWSYSLPGADLTNPKHLEFPQWPGEAPEPMQYAEFMTEDEMNAYTRDYVAWYAEGEAIGSWNYATEPDPVDYMTEDEKAFYYECMDVYQIQYGEWEKANAKFMSVYNSCIADGHPLTYNLAYLSGDGKIAVTNTSYSYEDPYSWSGLTEMNAPVVFNLEDGSYQVYPFTHNAKPSGVTDDYSILASVSSSTTPHAALIFKPGAKDPITLLEYMQEANPSIWEWIKKNMYHDVEFFDMETGEIVIEKDINCTGIPKSDPNMQLFVTYSENLWDYSTQADIFTYILPGKDETSVNKIADDSAVVGVKRGGTIIINAAVSHLEIFDLEGRSVYSAIPTADVVETGISSGIYILKAETPKGVRTLKIRF